MERTDWISASEKILFTFSACLHVLRLSLNVASFVSYLTVMYLYKGVSLRSIQMSCLILLSPAYMVSTAL